MTQVRKLQAELEELTKSALADKEHMKAGMGSLAGSMGKNSEKLQVEADIALQAIQALMQRIKLIAGTADTARQLESEI